MDRVHLQQGTTWAAGPPSGFGQPVDLLHRRVVLAEQHQFVGVQILGALWDTVLLQVFRRGDDMPLHCHQVALHEVGLLWRMHADRNVGFSHGQIQFGIVEQQ